MGDCVIQGCDRPVERHLPVSSYGTTREFCVPCYRAWRRGAQTTFTGGVPRAKEFV